VAQQVGGEQQCDQINGGMRRTDEWTEKWRLRRRGKWLQQPSSGSSALEFSSSSGGPKRTFHPFKILKGFSRNAEEQAGFKLDINLVSYEFFRERLGGGCCDGQHWHCGDGDMGSNDNAVIGANLAAAW
jgi:hypothetical protein